LLVKLPASGRQAACTTGQYLTETKPIDYLGCTLMTKSVIGTLDANIENMALALNMENAKAH
jgi:hypothetical protein